MNSDIPELDGLLQQPIGTSAERIRAWTSHLHMLSEHRATLTNELRAAARRAGRIAQLIRIPIATADTDGDLKDALHLVGWLQTLRATVDTLAGQPARTATEGSFPDTDITAAALSGVVEQIDEVGLEPNEGHDIATDVRRLVLSLDRAAVLIMTNGAVSILLVVDLLTWLNVVAGSLDRLQKLLEKRFSPTTPSVLERMIGGPGTIGETRAVLTEKLAIALRDGHAEAVDDITSLLTDLANI